MEPGPSESRNDVARPGPGEEVVPNALEEEAEDADVLASFRLGRGSRGDIIEDKAVPGGGDEEGPLAAPKPEGQPPSIVSLPVGDVDPIAACLPQGPGLPPRKDLLLDLACDCDSAEEIPPDADLPRV